MPKVSLVIQERFAAALKANAELGEVLERRESGESEWLEASGERRKRLWAELAELNQRVEAALQLVRERSDALWSAIEADEGYQAWARQNEKPRDPGGHGDPDESP